MFDHNNDETQLQYRANETVIDEKSIEMKRRSMAAAEKAVSLDWNVGDVILGLYEVKPVDGYGKVFHAGGFGKVYKVNHKTWNMDLAVKAPHDHAFKSQVQKENFMKECQSWIELGIHPNIATCYYVRELSGVPRIFAEYVTQGSLKDWIESGRLYEGNTELDVLKQILDIAIQFAWGLHYAHEKGMVHQDVKPHNVMMAEKGVVKVVDFGLARAKDLGGLLVLNEDKGQSIMVTSAGGYTPAYCSPEQISGKKLTRRSDMWSWGVSVMEMFTGGATWESGVLAAQSLESFLEHNGEEEDIPIMPSGVVELLRRCFKTNEIDRPHTMIDIANALIKIYQIECTLEYSRKWVESTHDTSDTLNNHALSYIDLGEDDRAEELWNQAIRNSSQHLESIYNRGLLLWRKGKIIDIELLSQLESIKLSYPSSWLYYYLQGMIHLERSDADSAIVFFEEALKLATKSEEVAFALMNAVAGKGKWSHFLRIFEGHVARVTSVALTTDGLYALSGSEDQTLRLWETSTGECIRTFEGHTKGVEAVALSANGLYALSGGLDYSLKFWEIATGACLRTIEVGGSIWSVAITANGRYLFSAYKNWYKLGELKIWDSSTGECIRTISPRTVSSIAVTADGRYTLSQGYHDMKLWNNKTGDCERSFKGHSDFVASIAISLDKRYVLSGSYDHTLKLWDISTGECIATMIINSAVHSVAINVDASYALSASGYDSTEFIKGKKYYTMQLWEVSTGKCIRTFERQSESITSIALSADGKFALSGSSDHTLKLWQIENSNIQAEWYISRPESGSEAITKEEQFKSYLDQAVEMLERGNYIMAVDFLTHAKALPGCNMLKEMRDAWAMLYKVLPKSRFENCWKLHSFESHTDRVNSVDISSDTRYVLSSGSDKQVKLWEISTGECIKTFEGHKKEVSSVTFSADGRYALSGSKDMNVKLWEISTSTCVKTFKADSFDAIKSVALGGNGRFMLSGGEGGRIKIRHIENGECLSVLENRYGKINSIAISPDCRYVLSGGSYVNFWNVQTGECLCTFKGDTKVVTSVAISADGCYGLLGGLDSTVKLWNVQSGECLHTFEGHTGEVMSVALSADGCFALSGSNDLTMKLWSIATGLCLHTFKGHSDGVLSVAMSVDSRYVVSGSADHTIKVWELDWDVKSRKQVDWEDGAKPFLKNFLIMHQQVSYENPLIYNGMPTWTEEDFNMLITELGYRGYGFLRQEGIKNKLEEMMKQF